MSKEYNDQDNENLFEFETLKVERQAAVLFAEIDAPPMNLMGPGLVRDLARLIQQAEADQTIQIIVFKTANPDYFISHVDVTQVKANREAAMALIGEPSLGQLFFYLSNSRLVTIAQIEGRVRGAGSEFILACDMRFAALETAIFSQFEASFGVIPGAGAAQHLARLLGRGRALEVLLSAEDYNAIIAERYGWINRALTKNELDDFVRALAHRIAGFPAAGRAIIKQRVNEITLADVSDIRRDSDLFLEGTLTREFQSRTAAAMKNGFQTPEGELDLARRLNELG
jgi:enoyl-CoA hydratase/carnithine racemase